LFFEILLAFNKSASYNRVTPLNPKRRKARDDGKSGFHFEIMGTDARALREFYGQAFGWSMKPVGGPADYAVVENGDGIRGGMGECPSGEYAGHVTFYVRVSDINGTLLTLEQLGGSRVMEPVPLPDGGQIAHFKDPQGHLIGLMQCE
jgi:predicted enzyme related to lactoylglutathione lyase